METTTEPMVHKALRVHFGVQIKTLTACGERTHSPPKGDASYKWPDVNCPACKALEPGHPGVNGET